jgi:post-segregation antitoxin (ccd killing protein)
MFAMSAVQKITVEVPADLLARARAASGDSLTATVREGLRLVAAGQAFRNLRALRGKVRFSESVATLRQDRD